MGVSSDPQTRIDERTIDSPELLEALDKRAEARGRKREAQSELDLRHAEVLAELEKHGLSEGDVVRIGTYRITKTKPTDSKTVTFETTPASRVMILELEGA